MRETDWNEDATLQSLDVEEEARSQRMQVPPGSWKRQGNNLSLEPPKVPCGLFIFKPVAKALFFPQ